MKLTFWILIVLCLCALVLKFYGKAGLKSVLVFAGILLTKDAISHFFGKTAEWIFIGLLAALAIAIYFVRRSKLDE